MIPMKTAVLGISKISTNQQQLRCAQEIAEQKEEGRSPSPPAAGDRGDVWMEKPSENGGSMVVSWDSLSRFALWK